MAVKHAFNSTVADGSSAGDVRPSNWNDAHVGTVTGSSNAVPEVLTRVFNVVSSNSSAAVSLINYSVPARTLGTNRMLRFTAYCDVTFGTTAVANNYQIEVFHGGSSRWKDTTSTLAAVGAIAPLTLSACVAALNSSGSRRVWGEILQTSGTAGVFGLGDLTAVGAAARRHMAGFASSASYTITTGAAETLQITFNWTAANSSLSMAMRYGTLELI